ncbi:MAG: DUF6067 family protein [Tannerella sp.]|jgi:hypothetical protein|nr:DUF6067 family protein [Tannerella sp.]
MKTVNFFLLVQALLYMVACGDKQVGDTFISTSEALEQQSVVLEGKAFFAYPEVRENPIRWYDSIPASKIGTIGKSGTFGMKAQPGEYFIFQAGVWAIEDDLSDIQVSFSDLKSGGGRIITSDKITCFNKGGIDFEGRPFTKAVPVKAGRVQALWFGIDLADAETGTYSGAISLIANDQEQSIPIKITVKGAKVADRGYDEGYRLSRLEWLNSTVGIDETITQYFTPVELTDNQVKINGRTMLIDKTGLPASILSYFNQSNEALVTEGHPVTNKPFRFVIELNNGTVVNLTPQPMKIIDRTPAKAVWKTLNTSADCDLEVTGQMEYDGWADYHLKLTAHKALNIKDIRLETPIVKEKAKYMMGLDHEGGYLSAGWTWTWDVKKHQDALWIGAVNGGLRLKWKAENYVRPLCNIYYAFGKLNLPPSWGNEGKGGVRLIAGANDVIISAFSGARTMQPNETLNYDFEMLITPFKTINRDIKYNDRYYHGGGTQAFTKIEKAQKVGATIINIHHAEDIYPFINYPYLDENVEALKRLVDSAHQENLRIKFYYTTRELTKNLPEFWAFYSLNGEVIFPGPGNESRTTELHPNGPNEWLIKNVREKYIPAWYNEIAEGPFKGEVDLSVITNPDSRLNNFYTAGLEWMMQHFGIDGVYIDDTALDRFTMRRMRKIIDRYRPEGRMDLHSWNHFNGSAGFASCLNLYMDDLPYFDLVWIGEGRDYNRAPDHWLIEVSGIPFGVAGQMLQNDGNQWRGMVYGITNRCGWTKMTPEYLWQFFDEYKFSERELLGYWDERCPVKTDNPNVIASVFKGANDVVIALGNWSDKTQTCSLRFNVAFPNASKTVLQAPEIENFQTANEFKLTDRIEVEGGKGLVLILK